LLHFIEALNLRFQSTSYYYSTASPLQFSSTVFLCVTCLQYPELNPMIMRRFEEPGDVERAFELVHKSQGLEQTRFLARKYNLEAVRLANTLAESPFQKALITAADMIINRMK